MDKQARSPNFQLPQKERNPAIQIQILLSGVLEAKRVQEWKIMMTKMTSKA